MGNFHYLDFGDDFIIIRTYQIIHYKYMVSCQLYLNKLFKKNVF